MFINHFIYLFIEKKNKKKELFFHIPGGAGENSSAFITHLSPKCRDYSKASLLRKTLSPPIPISGGAVDTND